MGIVEGEGPEGMESFSHDSVLVAQQLLQNPNHVVTYYSLAKAGFGQQRRRHRMEKIKASLEAYFLPRKYHIVIPQIGRKQSLGIGLQPLVEDYEEAQVRIPRALESQLESEILADYLPQKKRLNWLTLLETQQEDIGFQSTQTPALSHLRIALPPIEIGKLPPVNAVILEREYRNRDQTHEVKFADPANNAILQAVVASGGYVDSALRAHFYNKRQTQSISVEVQEVNRLFGEEILQRLDTGYAIYGEYQRKATYMSNWVKQFLGKNKSYIETTLSLLPLSQRIAKTRVTFDAGQTGLYFIDANDLFFSLDVQHAPWISRHNANFMLLYADSNGVCVVEISRRQAELFSAVFKYQGDREVAYDPQLSQVLFDYDRQWQLTTGLLEEFIARLKKYKYPMISPGHATKNLLIFPTLKTS